MALESLDEKGAQEAAFKAAKNVGLLRTKADALSTNDVSNIRLSLGAAESLSNDPKLVGQANQAIAKRITAGTPSLENTRNELRRASSIDDIESITKRLVQEFDAIQQAETVVVKALLVPGVSGAVARFGQVYADLAGRPVKRSILNAALNV